jgi:hypothetical protein
MRSFLPIILVLLAVFTAGCIIYIAWELSAGQPESTDSDPDQSDSP